MLQAMGMRLLDARGREIGARWPAVYRNLAAVELDGLDPRVAGTAVVLASDVDNPLLGTHGAARVYGPQKGASAQQVAELEAGLERWAGLVGAATGHDLTGAAGAGAAGGVGFAALSVLGAERQPGVDVVLGLIGFEDLLSGARLVITGEGSLDEQSSARQGAGRRRPGRRAAWG